MADALQLVLASNNLHKRDEIEARLRAREATVDIRVLDDPPSPEETGETFTANALLKAFAWYARTGEPSLADDSGLVVAALGGEPGVYSSRFAAREGGAEALPRDLANNLELLRRLADADDRSAAFHCALALVASSSSEFGRWLLAAPLPDDVWRLVDGGRVAITCEGATTGQILDVPVEHDGECIRGVTSDRGFGYDPIFRSDDLGRTFSEVTAAEKNDVSHRARALDRLAALLDGWPGSAR